MLLAQSMPMLASRLFRLLARVCAGERLPQLQGELSTTFVFCDVCQRAAQVVLGDVPAGT